MQTDDLQVDRGKLVEYLLSPEHPDGRSKARFFNGLGYTASNWEFLAKALCEHARTNPALNAVETPYGVRYTVEGDLDGALSRSARIRSIWIQETGSRKPRLVTAYPC